MKIVFISDVHCKWNKVTIPECDILISAGDYSFNGESHVVKNFHKWLNKQPANHIVSINGNHERWVESNYDAAKSIVKDVCPRAYFIQHESIEIEGIKIFGSAYTPAFFNWAYMAGRDIVEASTLNLPFIGDLWAYIPLDTQILVTHGPGLGTLDQVIEYGTGKIKHAGCRELQKKIGELKDLKIHAFGHLHLLGGKTEELDGVTYVNAAICDDRYNPCRTPIEIIL